MSHDQEGDVVKGDDVLNQKDVVEVYSAGFVYCSVCAPEDMSIEVLEHAVNAQNPAGPGLRWKVADEPFRDGTPNPSPCSDGHSKKHYLLSC